MLIVSEKLIKVRKTNKKLGPDDRKKINITSNKNIIGKLRKYEVVMTTT